MPATCCQCDQVTNRFSQSEYRAAVRDNDGECRDCKAEIPRCTDCGREFHSGNFKSRLNALKMHKQTHRRKTVQCPVCEGEKRYASGDKLAIVLPFIYISMNKIKLFTRDISRHTCRRRRLVTPGVWLLSWL